MTEETKTTKSEPTIRDLLERIDQLERKLAPNDTTELNNVLRDMARDTSEKPRLTIGKAGNA